jgi:hypothetical protein
MALNDIIGICCIPTCNRIRVNNEANLWLGRDENPHLYDELIQGKRLSHGYCPEHYEQAIKELEEDKHKIENN